MKKRIREILFFILLLPASLWSLEITIVVMDPVAKKPVPNSQIIVAGVPKKFRTNARGESTIQVPQTGFYTIRVITPEGKLLQPRIQVKSPGQRLTIFTSTPSSEVKKDQTVSGDQSIQVKGIRKKQKVSRYQVRLDEIKRIPGQFGEALRGIETLPGVNAPSFGNGDIVIRGANADANTYLLDRLPIGYAFHFFPLNSVLANDLIDTIDLYNGAYPANYGDATGGIIDITTIDEVTRFGGNANFSLWAANVIFKAPMFFSEPIPDTIEIPTAEKKSDDPEDKLASDTKDNEESSSSGSYWIAAGRGSYMDKTLKQFVPDGIRLPVYYDTQFKARIQFNKNHALYFYSLVAKDTFGVDIKAEPPNHDPTKEFDPVIVGARFATDKAFHTEAIRHVWQPGSSFRNELTTLYHNNIEHLDGKLGNLEAKFRRQTGWVSIIDEFDWVLKPRHIRLEGGLEYRQFIYKADGTFVRPKDPNDESPDFFDPDNPDFERVPLNDSESVPYASGFTMLTLAGGGFEFKPGLRYDYFGPIRQTVVDPRGTLSYTFETGTTIFTGGGIYHKTPEPFQISASSGNPNLFMERAEQYAAGLEQIWENWQFRMEVFRNYYTDIVVVDPYATTPFRKNTDPFKKFHEPVLIDDSLGYSNDGTGFAEGFEIYLKRDKPKDENGWYGWITYTWSRSIRNDHQHILTDDEKNILRTKDELKLVTQYDNTKDHYADFDRTHIINVIFGYKLSREWQIGARWVYKTAPPYTQIIGDDGGRQRNLERTIYDPKYSDLINTKRLHPYHRLDIRIDRFFHYDWGYGNYYIEILNVYVRENPDRASWDNARPHSATNPSITNDFLLLETPGPGGTVNQIPFFNIGLEMKF